MADSDWAPFRAEIERLYAHENQTLTEVMNYLTTKHDFHRTKSQYERQLRRWGLRKYQARQTDWRFIGRRIDKRKRESNKDSEVFVDGIQQPLQKVRRERYRKAFLSTVDRVVEEKRAKGAIAPSPATPEGIVVCTAAAPGASFVWSPSPPWLRFLTQLQPGQDQDRSALSPMLSEASPRSPDLLRHSVKLKLTKRLCSIVPWERLNSHSGIQSISRTAAALDILMPEIHTGQNEYLATKLCETMCDSSTSRLILELYVFSNNLSPDSSSEMSAGRMRANDRRVMETLQLLGWKSAKEFELLLSATEPTAEAIAEKLFASALRLCDVKTVALMLDAGMKMNLILAHEEGVNLLNSKDPAIRHTILARDEEATRLLLSHGATVTSSCLASAAIHSSEKLFMDLLDAFSEVGARDGWQDASALGHAVTHGRVGIIKMLLRAGAGLSELTAISFDGDLVFTDVLGLGAMTGDMEIIALLLEEYSDVDPAVTRLPYVSPLTLAVEVNSVEITQLLLKKGVDLEVADRNWQMTLLERAVKKENVQLCGILLQHGADVNGPRTNTKLTSALLEAVKRGCLDIASLLIQNGAQVNEVYSTAPGTVLGAAIEQGHLAMIQMLQGAGGDMAFSINLQRIGNLDTAMHLSKIGILPDILLICGHDILTAAVLAKDAKLVQYLLGGGFEFEQLIAARNEKTTLGAAIQTGNHSCVEILLARGARVTDCDLTEAVKGTDVALLRRLLSQFVGNGPSAVGAVISRRRLDLLQLLLDAGVSPIGIPQSQDGWKTEKMHLESPESVLEIAARDGDKEILQLLLQSVPWDPKLSGRALTVAVICAKHGLVDCLLESGADVGQDVRIHHPPGQDEYGGYILGHTEVINPLQAAVKRQQISVVERLAPVSDINHLGAGARRRTALQHAVENGNMELINLLLDLNFDINGAPATDNGATALQIAAMRGYLGIARMLIKQGANVNADGARDNGRTALEGAAEHGRIDMLQLLHEAGACIDGEGERQYHNAINLADNNGHHAAARLLRTFKQAASRSPCNR
ncbi:hypothetical protein ASPBRDRAFT_56797 [Aspergillus brasiliensis CBS 101740]|uniref:Clr5 domain-containing protein n=1 Tax=Aspergillus brasiliensis (strain CBS 101740 / IMI 381727 / IBT 21946) TaxID=767769 RepID=A0A1L9UEH1_ASPBC|nr:hypothetical protein ASPBRDRAFT_56797 [Aspergillus brasiliensis CBS 101740]